MEKLSEEVKLFEEMVEFMERLNISNKQLTIDDRKALSVARDKVYGVHREMSAVILSSSSLAIDASVILRDYRTKLGKELNDICNKLSNFTIKANVKDHVDSFLHDYDFCIDDDDHDEEINPYLEETKKQCDDYLQTLLFLAKLEEFAEREKVSGEDITILLHAYSIINRFYRGLYKTTRSVKSSSVWDMDVSLTINEARTKVQNELNYIYNNITDHTIKEAISYHLVGYEAGHRPTRLLPPILAEWKRVSSQSEMERTKKKSKLGSLGRKERNKKREYAYLRRKAIFKDDPIDERKGIEIQPASTTDDSWEDEYSKEWKPFFSGKKNDDQHAFSEDDYLSEFEVL